MEGGPGQQRTLDLIQFQPILLLQAREQQRPAAIGPIPDGRQPGVAKMNSDLVRAVGQWLALQEGEPGESFPNLEDRQRTFAAHGDRRA